MKRVFILLLLLLFLPTIYSFNVCNVGIYEPWFIVQENITNKSILIVDSQGDIYFEGIDHTLNNNETEKSFQVGNAFFNQMTSKFTLFSQNQLTVPTDNSLIIQNNLGVNIASFSNIGNIYTKGKGVFNGSQAGCLIDGNYCNGNIVENRDNYCNITSTKVGVCTYSISGTENCATKLSSDTDGGANYNLRGFVIDYEGCSEGRCANISYTDSCIGTSLTEYLASGSSYSSVIRNCGADNTRYCSGTNVMTTNYLCGSGACYRASDSLIQTCSATTTSYGLWSCSNINTKVRSVTTYSPTCSNGVCGASTVNPSTNEYSSCSGGTYCSSGNCNTITYSWYQSGFGACSVSCGGGTQSQTVYCKRDYDGAVVSDNFCSSSGIKPSVIQSCNTQSCCGNGIINTGEICDIGNLNSQSCTTLGFTGGTLSCNSICNEYITSSCTTSFSQEGTGCANCPFGSYYYRFSGVFEDGSSGYFYACYLNGNWISKSSYYRGIRYSKYTQAINDPSSCEQRVYINGIYSSTQTYSWKITSNPPAQECTFFGCSNW